jgi:hypothetical protein
MNLNTVSQYAIIVINIAIIAYCKWLESPAITCAEFLFILPVSVMAVLFLRIGPGY